MINLWKHQQEMVDFALSKKRVMWNVWMSGGKTRAGVAFIDKIGGVGLILCPKAVIPTWVSTIEGLLETPVYTLLARTNANLYKRIQELPATLDGILVANYDIIHRAELLKYLNKQKLNFIICDESHRIKSHNSKNSKAVYNLGKGVPYKLCLTGTPTPNNPLDLFGQFRFLDDGILGKYWGQFQQTYADLYQLPATSVKVVRGYKNQDQLAASVRPFMYELTLDDMLKRNDLPDFPTVQHVRVPVTLPAKITKALSKLKDDFIAEVESGLITADNVLVKMLRMSQLTSGLAVTTDLDQQTDYRMVDTTKLDSLVDFLSDVDTKEPVVIFAKFRHEINYLREKLGKDALELSGVYNQLKAWQGGEARYLVVQIDSGAEGVDLTRARIAVFFSNTYDLGKYQQAVARLQRANSEHDRVVYYHFIATDSVDEVLYQALQKKQNINNVLYDYIRKAN